MERYLILFYVVGASATIPATNFCALKCGERENIGCNHPNKLQSTCPKDAKVITLDKSLQQILVDAHNELRNKIAGGSKFERACRMATLSWNEELAYLAGLNVMQCKMKHDRCRNINGYAYVAQNLAMVPIENRTTDYAYEVKEAVNRWQSEMKKISQSSVKKVTFNKDIGHFVIMIREMTSRVGCAAVYLNDDNYGKVILVACNYAANNMVLKPIYKSCSTAASECKSHNEVYKNLCGESEP